MVSAIHEKKLNEENSIIDYMIYITLRRTDTKNKYAIYVEFTGCVLYWNIDYFKNFSLKRNS